MIIFKKIMKDLGKEKTFVFVILMQIFLIASITLILSFTAVFFSPESLVSDNLNIGTLNMNEEIKIDIFNNDRRINLINYDLYPNNIEQAITDIQNNEIDTLIILEEIDPYIFTIYLPDSEIESTLILSLIKEKFEIFENQQLKEYSNVIDIGDIRVIGERNKGSDYIYEIIYGFLIPFLFLIPIFLVGSLLIDIITQEIESKTIILIKSATNLKQYFNEVIIASLFMSFLQIILWTFLIQLRGIGINNIPQLMIYLILFSLFISNCAILIALKLKTKTKAQLVYSILIMLISLSIGISLYNPIVFISTIVSGIIVAPLLGYLIIGLLTIITYIILIRESHKEI